MIDVKKMAYDIVELIDEKLGHDISLLDVQKISSVSDYFIIASGNSNRQVIAIADNVEHGMEKEGHFIKHKEGHRDGNWVLLDFGDIVVHVFNKEQRDFYNLEKLWCDAIITKFDVDTVKL